MRVTIKNEYGSIDMQGGGHPTWNITDYDGLGLPPKTYNIVQYAGSAGQRTLSETAQARTITIGGDIGGQYPAQEVTKATKMFYCPVDVIIYAGNKHRRARCRVTSFSAEQGHIYRKFTLQMVSDSPYFEDLDAQSIMVHERTNHLLGRFSFESASSKIQFSTLTTESDIINLGDVQTEPIFYVSNNTGATITDGFAILKNGGDQKISVSASIDDGETVTVDIPSRRITGSNGRNLIDTISDDTFLSDFWLDVGTNHIEVESGNKNLSVRCEYTNQYVEAML